MKQGSERSTLPWVHIIFALPLLGYTMDRQRKRWSIFPIFDMSTFPSLLPQGF